MGGRFQVLSLDGGGAKALFTAAVLADLEQDHGINITDCFDLIVGTSAGGIVALGLGAGVPPAHLLEHFRQLNRQVFPSSRRRNFLRRLLRPAYDPEQLREALHGVLGDRLLRDSSKRLLIPAYDVGAGTVHVFKTPHHPAFGATDACPWWTWRSPPPPRRRTSPPTAECRAPGSSTGACGPTTPVASASRRQSACSTLTSPMCPCSASGPPTRSGTRRAWIAEACCAGRRRPTVVLTATSRGMNGVAVHLIGDRFVRFDAAVPKGTYALDKVDADDLNGLAANVSRELGPTFDAHFAEHRSPGYQPCPQPSPGATL